MRISSVQYARYSPKWNEAAAASCHAHSNWKQESVMGNGLESHATKSAAFPNLMAELTYESVVKYEVPSKKWNWFRNQCSRLFTRILSVVSRVFAGRRSTCVFRAQLLANNSTRPAAGLCYYYCKEREVRGWWCGLRGRNEALKGVTSQGAKVSARLIFPYYIQKCKLLLSSPKNTSVYPNEQVRHLLMAIHITSSFFGGVIV